MARGWVAIQSGANADDLVAHFVSEPVINRLFHLSGLHTRGDIAERLRAAGMTVEHVALYDQRLMTLSPEAVEVIAQRDVIAPLFSPRTAAQFAKMAPRLTSTHVIALSQAVADAMGSLPLGGLIIADHPDARSMGAALADLILRNPL
jgi:uroporphyrinogen-III synthase